MTDSEKKRRRKKVFQLVEDHRLLLKCLYDVLDDPEKEQQFLEKIKEQNDLLRQAIKGEIPRIRQELFQVAPEPMEDPFLEEVADNCFQRENEEAQAERLEKQGEED